MDYLYKKIEEREDRHRLLKNMVPRFIHQLVNKFLYKKRYPQAVVSVESRIMHGAEIGKHAIIRHSAIGSNVRIGDFTTIGHQCRMQGKGYIEIGKFCSIAPECFFWSENHRLDNGSTYPFEQFLTGRNQDYVEYLGEDITIGNDVWIGQRAIILAGANVGDGCMIAAGAVVPKGDYPPYSVIAGVPAKVVKYRLPEETIAEMLELKWWDKPEKEIFGSTMMNFLHQGHKLKS